MPDFGNQLIRTLRILERQRKEERDTYLATARKKGKPVRIRIRRRVAT
jgi:hypothetical protein